MTIDDIVVLHDVFARIVVVTLDAFLRGFERLTDGTVFDRHVLLDTKAIHERRNAITLKDTHQIIFGADIKLRTTWITLTTTTTTQLIVDTTCLVSLTP